MTVTKIAIKGMHCDSCARLIEDVARERDGVRSCIVDRELGTGSIEHDGTFDFDGFAAEVAGLDDYEVKKL